MLIVQPLLLALVLVPLVAHSQLMIVGNDEKVAFDKTGKQIRRPPGKDSVSIVDVSNPEAPKIVANFGYPGPYTPQIQEVGLLFVLPDIFTRVARGQSVDDSLKWGVGEYQRSEERRVGKECRL